MIAVAGTLLLVSLFAAACGSEDEPEGEDFATEANTICTDATRAIGDVNLTQGFEQDEADTIERIETVMPIREQALADLEALEPGAEQADAYDEYLGHRADQLARRPRAGGGTIRRGRVRGANMAPCCVEMSDLSENARLALDSLETKPALNTPALIAQNEGIEREEAEAGLAELAEAGLARQSMMGWKLRR